MRIALDIMGGDHAPQEIINGGLAAALNDNNLHIIMVGTKQAIQALPKLPPNVSTCLCGSVMAMDEAVDNLMKKKDSSIFIATKLVKDKEADAIVSAGSTGAQMAAAVLLLGRAKGVKRPAIASVLPALEGPKVILDMGANPDADATMLAQFAMMGKIFAEIVLHISSPRIALLSNGSEECKGNETVIEAHQLLKEQKELNFVGNIEGRYIVSGKGFDVITCDGFAGNIAVKTIEGTAGAIFSLMKEELSKNVQRKLGTILIHKGLQNIKNRMDYAEYGGAPLVGIKGISIICHGSSKAKAITNACKVAQSCFDQQFTEKIAAAFCEQAENN